MQSDLGYDTVSQTKVSNIIDTFLNYCVETLHRRAHKVNEFNDQALRSLLTTQRRRFSLLQEHFPLMLKHVEKKI